MKIFQTFRNFFKQEPEERVSFRFTLVSSHRNGKATFTRTFTTLEEANDWLNQNATKLHLNYIRTVLYNETDPDNVQIVEWHEHLVADFPFEENRIHERAREEGAVVSYINAYPNESSASSLKATFSYV